jgi:hypothetical protein
MHVSVIGQREGIHPMVSRALNEFWNRTRAIKEAVVAMAM